MPISNSHQYYAGFILDAPIDENGDWPSFELQWIGDLNNDGYEDVVYISHTGYLLSDLDDPSFTQPHANLHILYSNGVGFDQQLVLGPVIDFVSGMDAVDLDNDGLKDIVVYQTAAMPPEGDGSNYKVNQSVVWNNGTHWINQEVSTTRIDGHGGALGDINNDGINDVFILSESSLADSLIMISTGERGFDIRALSEDTGSYGFQISGIPYLSGVVELVDTDFDGDLDLVLAADNMASNTSSAGVYTVTIENQGGQFTGDISEELLYPLSKFSTDVTQYAPTDDPQIPEYLRTYLRQSLDLDGDGVKEILFMIDADRQLGPAVFGYSQAAGRFIDRTDEFFDRSEFYRAFYDGFYSQDVARLVDADGDGHRELFLSHYGSTGFDQLPNKVINILEQGSDGVYRAADVFDYRTLVAHDVSETMPIDINADGIFELIAIDRTGYNAVDGLTPYGYSDLKGEAVNLYFRDSSYSQTDVNEFNRYLELQANSDFVFGPNAKWESYLMEGPDFNGLLYGLEPYTFIKANPTGSQFDVYFTDLPSRVDLGDYHLALDITGHAGTTAKILGAVFGADALQNREYAGIGLSMLDAGISSEDLMSLAIEVALGVDATSEQVVNLLYQNVVGEPPSQSDAEPYIEMLESGNHSFGSLGILAAETTMNVVNIDLPGLMQTGLAYDIVS